MDSQKPSLPSELRHKLLKLASAIGTPSLHQQTCEFVLKNSPRTTALLQQQFDMTLNTFIKFVSLFGCKMAQIKDELNQFSHYIVAIPAAVKEETSPMKYSQNYDEISIEVNLAPSDNQLQSIQREGEIKQNFLTNLKENIKKTNNFVDNAVYKILVDRATKKLSICEVQQLLTELRDRMFENQKQVQEWAEFFQQKLTALGSEPDEMHQESGSKFRDEESRMNESEGFSGSKKKL